MNIALFFLSFAINISSVKTQLLFNGKIGKI